jgi:hypothetical protein
MVRGPCAFPPVFAYSCVWPLCSMILFAVTYKLVWFARRRYGWEPAEAAGDGKGRVLRRSIFGL